MIIFGIDAGFASLGWAMRRFDPIGRTVGEIVDAGVLTTDGEDGPQGEDDVRRMDELAQGLVLLVGDHKPKVIAYERPIGAQGARAATTLGMAHGLIRGLFVDVVGELERPLIDVTPREVKLALAGDVGADKDAMIEAASRKHWPQLRAMKPGLQEHAADAIGVTLAALHGAPFAQFMLSVGFR